jgi:O-antigen/teichoic acid export membrane protein
VVLQFAHPIGAELTRQHAAGEIAKARRLFFSAGRLLSATAGVLAGFALVAAAPFIRVWTHGEVAYDPWLVAAFVAPIIFMAPAFTAQMLYQYNNKPLILVFTQGGFTVGTVALCILLIGGFSAAGAAAATGLAECLSIGLLVPYAASREIALPILPYLCRCHVAGGAALATSAAVAWTLQHWLQAEGLLGLVALGLLWSALMAGPAFFLLLGAEERHWALLEVRSALLRFSGRRMSMWR